MPTIIYRKYHLQENQALDGQQVVTVYDSAGKAVWTKTRALDEDEIVSTVFDSLHHPRWRISRPTTGWYLILQRVSTRDEPFIELKPTRKNGGEMELVFAVPTPLQPAPEAQNGRKSPSVRLDMAPTQEQPPTSTQMTPTSSASSASTAASSASSAPLPVVDPQQTPTRRDFPPSQPSTSRPSTFRLTSAVPHTFASEHPHTAGFLARIKGLVAEKKKRWCVVWDGEGESGMAADEEKIMMAFEEGHSGFFTPHLTGTLSLSPHLIDASGLEPSFWVALCCAYADVVEEREGWEAAREGD
ncbi:hypothetical protein JCM11641_004986 [Rhodosporidiobolus odoratus]